MGTIDQMNRSLSPACFGPAAGRRKVPVTTRLAREALIAMATPIVCLLITVSSTHEAASNAASAVYDVTSYGAVGDGSTDDTVSIYKALADASKSARPSVVLFPKNKFFLTGPLNMSSHMTLRVDGTILAKSGNNTADGIKGWLEVPLPKPRQFWRWAVPPIPGLCVRGERDGHCNHW